MRHLRSWGCAIIMVLSLHDVASAKDLTIGQLKALVNDLGYQADSDDKSYVSITGQGKWQKTIFLTLQDNGESLEIYSNFGAIPDDGKKVVPYAEMLSANDDSPYYFSMGRVDGKPTVFQETRMAGSMVNKQSLRKLIDARLVRIDATEPIWGQDHWAVAAAPVASAVSSPANAAAPPAAQIFCSPSPGKDQLTLRSATFRSGPADTEGSKPPRPTSVFGPEEKMYVVLEIAGFQCNPVDDGKYRSVFAVKQDVKMDSDKEYEPFSEFSKSLDIDPQKKIDTAFIDIAITAQWKMFGSFSFRYTVRDNVSGREASIVVPFSVSASK